jgi:hypothetical protein
MGVESREALDVKITYTVAEDLGPRGPLRSLGAIERAGGPGGFLNAPQCFGSRF